MALASSDPFCNNQTISSVTTKWISPSVIQVWIPNGNYDIEDDKVFIEAELERIPHGSFEVDITLQGERLW